MRPIFKLLIVSFHVCFTIVAVECNENNIHSPDDMAQVPENLKLSAELTTLLEHSFKCVESLVKLSNLATLFGIGFGVIVLQFCYQLTKIYIQHFVSRIIDQQLRANEELRQELELVKQQNASIIQQNDDHSRLLNLALQQLQTVQSENPNVSESNVFTPNREMLVQPQKTLKNQALQWPKPPKNKDLVMTMTLALTYPIDSKH